MFRVQDKTKRELMVMTGIAMCLHLLLYRQVWVRLVDAWSYKPQCSHGYFVVPVCLWLCMKKIKDVSSVTTGYCYFGLILFSAGMVMHLYGYAAGVETVSHFSYMVSLAGIIISLWGYPLFKVFLFPYLFLIFMFPIPDYLYLDMTGRLKLLATNLSAFLISAMGIPVVR